MVLTLGLCQRELPCHNVALKSQLVTLGSLYQSSFKFRVGCFVLNMLMNLGVGWVLVLKLLQHVAISFVKYPLQ